MTQPLVIYFSFNTVCTQYQRQKVGTFSSVSGEGRVFSSSFKKAE